VKGVGGAESREGARARGGELAMAAEVQGGVRKA
jgi:hypothetical protein